MAMLPFRSMWDAHSQPFPGSTKDRPQPSPLPCGEGLAGGLAVGDELLGRSVGPYQIVERIGQGGMGVVYRAVHSGLSQVAALKVLAATQDPLRRARFLREARALSTIRHPGLVQIFDAGTLHEDRPYLLMELVPGQTLRARLAAQPRLPLALALDITAQVAAVLLAIHGQNIVHRDLKPDNVMLLPDPSAPAGVRVKVLDLGIAKFQDDDGPQTSAGLAVGTPGYMSPEQCLGEGAIAGAADVYSLGVMLFEMLRGVPPFVGDPQRVLCAHLSRRPPRLDRREAPRAIDALVAQMLHKAPRSRPTAAAVLSTLTDGPRARGPQRWRLSRALPTATAQTALAVRLPRRSSWLRRALLGALALLLVCDSPSGPRSAAPRRAHAKAAPRGMVYLEGGRLRMGVTPEVARGAFAACKLLLGFDCLIYQRDQPQRSVWLSPFSLDVYEVTNEEYAAWLALQPDLRVEHEGRMVYARTTLLLDLYPTHSGLSWSGVRVAVRAGSARRPVVQVTWEGAQRYCAARGASLPTEAQWEFAARGSEGRTYPWGEDPPRCQDVAFGRRACPGQPAEIAEVGAMSQDRTAAGIHDLAGNAAEWVLDQMQAPYPPCAGGCIDPVVLPQRSEDPRNERVYRGSSWQMGVADLCRGSRRSRRAQSSPMAALGFRCASAAPE